MIKKILTALCITLCIVGCDSMGTEDLKNTFTTTFTRYGLYQNAVPKFTYTESDHQIATKIGSGGMGELYEFRLMNDTQSQLLSLEMPQGITTTNGVTVSATLNTVGISGVEATESYNMLIIKTTDERMWLWDASTSVGIIAPVAQ